MATIEKFATKAAAEAVASTMSGWTVAVLEAKYYGQPQGWWYIQCNGKKVLCTDGFVRD